MSARVHVLLDDDSRYLVVDAEEDGQVARRSVTWFEARRRWGASPRHDGRDGDRVLAQAAAELTREVLEELAERTRPSCGAGGTGGADG